MTLFQTDIEHIIRPLDKPRVFDELPPKVSHEDLKRMRMDAAANQALADACRDAFAYGRIHMVSVHFSSGPGPQEEAIAIETAVALVRSRGLHELMVERPGNPDGPQNNPKLIEEGLKWAKTLHNETFIVEAMEKAFPFLSVDYHSLANSPVPGAPWKGTTLGEQMNCEKKREIWTQVEELGQAIKIATTPGEIASSGLVSEGNRLMKDLIARTPDLPSDRVVLDPEGRGIKLLPKGRQRALWQHTGDSYLFEPERAVGKELNDFELPPLEELRDTSCADARPCCATFASGKPCKLGKRCPWRHKMPLPGDSVREPVFHS